MKKIFVVSAMSLLVSIPTFAGGLLTNTNQNAAFLRNPSRDAVIAIDGVYSNPAGIAFMPQGFHLSVSWQAAWQKRQMEVSNNLYGFNADNKSSNRLFEGTAKAPIIPSLQAAYVINDKWSVSGQFAVGGGGGKCEFADGLPMFEELIGGLAASSGASYSLKQGLTGEQYFYGIQVGGTYKLADNFSVFGGVRAVLANCSYVGAIDNILINGMNSAQYMDLAAQAKGGAEQCAAAAAQYAAAGMMAEAAQYEAMAKDYAAKAVQAGTVGTMIQDYKLDCSQSGVGFTPIIGFDWNLGKLNLAAKYEFRTKVNLENESNNSDNLALLASQKPEVAIYADGKKVRSDIPAILTLGAQYQVTDAVRVMGGFHYYWDKDAKAGLDGASKLMNYGDNTWEANLGLEWDVNDKVLLSIGGQRTQYGFDDKDMSDTSFNISSTAVCVGGAYKFNEKMKLNVGYMHSFYGNHKFTNANKTACDYTRKNDVIGASLDITF